MIYAFIFLIGLAFGSFASVLIHRLHTGEKGILRGRSKCPFCSKKLATRDLIPLVSYLVNQFRCRSCKKPISAFYPVLELSMAGLFLLTAYLIGTSNIADLIFYLFISFVFVVLTFYDFLFKEVPDEVSLPAIVIALTYVVFQDIFTTRALLLGVLVPVAFFSTLHFGSRGKWLGGGDIRIGALMGAILGYPMILTALFFGYLSGSIFSITGLLMGKFDRRTQIPFAPFLLLGAYVSIFWGQAAVDWYFSFL